MEGKSKNIDHALYPGPTHKNIVEVYSVQEPKCKLNNGRWAVETKPKGVIVLFHGIGAHMGGMNHFAALFVSQGYEVVGYDS